MPAAKNPLGTLSVAVALALSSFTTHAFDKETAQWVDDEMVECVAKAALNHPEWQFVSNPVGKVIDACTSKIAQAVGYCEVRPGESRDSCAGAALMRVDQVAHQAWNRSR